MNLPHRNTSSKAVKEWLADYKALSPSEVHTFAVSIYNNQELIEGISHILHDLENESQDPVCHQLFNFYRSSEMALRRFAKQFLPTLIHVYLESVANNTKIACGTIETLLLGIYNLSVVNEDGSSITHSFRIPVLSQPSVYHEKLAFEHQGPLTEHALSRYELQEPRVITVGPYSVIEMITASNRLLVMSHLVSNYNADITNMPKDSYFALCHLASRVAKAGFHSCTSVNTSNCRNAISHDSNEDKALDTIQNHERRIVVNSMFLLEVLHSLYYIMYSGLGSQAQKSVKEIQERASQELLPDVIMVANAIQNSFNLKSTDGQPEDGMMGISVSASSSASSVKGVITNASFRIKKLPDDITVVVNADAPTASNSPSMASSKQNTLSSISEEQSHETVSIDSKLSDNADKPVVKEKTKSISAKIALGLKKGEKRLRRESGSDTSTSLSQNGDVNKIEMDVSRRSKSMAEPVEFLPLKERERNAFDGKVKKSESLPDSETKKGLHFVRTGSEEDKKCGLRVERSHSEDEKHCDRQKKHSRSLSDDDNISSSVHRSAISSAYVEDSTMTSSSELENGVMIISPTSVSVSLHDSPVHETTA